MSNEKYIDEREIFLGEFISFVRYRKGLRDSVKRIVTERDGEVIRDGVGYPIIPKEEVLEYIADGLERVLNGSRNPFPNRVNSVNNDVLWRCYHLTCVAVKGGHPPQHKEEGGAFYEVGKYLHLSPNTVQKHARNATRLLETEDGYNQYIKWLSRENRVEIYRNWGWIGNEQIKEEWLTKTFLKKVPEKKLVVFFANLTEEMREKALTMLSTERLMKLKTFVEILIKNKK